MLGKSVTVVWGAGTWDIRSFSQLFYKFLQDPDVAWNIFKDKYINILNTHAPFKHFNTRADRKAWVTTEFLENANEHDNLAKSWGCSVLRERFRLARNRVVSLKRDFKHHYFRVSIQDAHGDSAKLWKL